MQHLESYQNVGQVIGVDIIANSLNDGSYNLWQAPSIWSCKKTQKPLNWQYFTLHVINLNIIYKYRLHEIHYFFIFLL